MVMLAAAPVAGMAAKAAMDALRKRKGGRATGPRARRRRRGGLTAKHKADIIWLRANAGKTAAANYIAAHVH